MEKTTARERGRELKRFRETLEAKQAELLHGLNKREGLEVESAADTMDTQQKAVALELRIVSLERDSTLLRSVRTALARIADGSYGICTACEEPISPRRLSAVPWTPYCLKCQELADQGNLALLEELVAEVS
jgi:RNA polymerase-binding transcription factor